MIPYRDRLVQEVENPGQSSDQQESGPDIIKCKNIEERLKLTQFALDHVGVSVLWIYPDARFAYVNEAATKSLGYSREELLRMTVFDIDPAFPREAWSEHWQKIRQQGSLTIESFHRSKEGREYPVEISVNYLYDGTQEFICAFAQDITERTKAREQLQKERDFSRSILQASAAYFVTISADGRTLMMNSSMLDALGYTEEEVIGKDYLTTFVPEEDREALNDVFRDIIEQKKATFNENHILTKDGRKLCVEWRGRPMFDDRGEFEFFFGVGIDLTERNRSEEAVRQLSRQNELILASAAEGIFGMDKEGIITFMNRSAEKMVGWKADELFGKSMHEMTHHTKSDGTPYPLEECKMFAAYSDDRMYQGDDDIFWRKDGTSFPISYASTPVRDEQGNILGAMVTFQDITERKQSEEEMRKLSTAIEQATDWVVMTDRQGNIVYANRIVEEISGYDREELVGQTPKIFKSGRHDDAYYKEMWDTLLSGESFRGTLTNRKKSGELFYINHTITPLKDKAGNITHFLSTAKDITQEKILQDRINYLAFYDELTSLPNRTLFMDRLNQAISRSVFKQRIFAVLIIGLDRFKMINDSYGPEIGDDVLKEVAQRLSGSTREGDTVARLRSDEFGILLLDMAHSDDIILVIEKIKKNILEIMKVNGAEIVITPSIGIAMHPNDGNTSESLIQNAYIANSKAYEQGGNSYQFYAHGMNEKATEFMKIERHLYNALSNNEFVLYYQPYFDVMSEKIAGMEALIRWESPDMGFVSPGKFIPVLEETGMIKDVGDWIIGEACRQIGEWKQKGYAIVPVSVNFSSLQFQQKNLLEKIARLVNEYGISPEHFILEITESAFMHDIEFTRMILGKIKERGFAISIDDFGTGYSSLKYLKILPIDKLKIDISFVREIVTDPDSASLVTAIISMAHNLGLKTIAEGVETEDQWRILRILRCDMVQGFYKSRPLPPLELEKFLIHR